MKPAPHDRLQPVRKVGVLGGTFDPVHRGHLAVARFVRAQLGLDEFIFIPAPRPPHKIGAVISPFADRLAMLELALADQQGFSVSDLEADRRGPSYSVDTLAQLHESHGPGIRLYFVIGLDAFLELHTWKEYRRLPDLADLVVINRPDYPAGRAVEVIGRLGDFRYDQAENCWSAPEVTGRIHLLSMAPVEISSTQVRHAAAAGRSLESLVFPKVAAYIREHGLYL